MEQKQLDELDESFFGEEYVDEEDDFLRDNKMQHKSAPKEQSPSKTKDTKEAKARTIKMSSKKEEKEKNRVSDVKADLSDEQEKRGDSHSNSTTMGSSPPPHDPWANSPEKSEQGGAVFWKVSTGVLLILLAVAIITQGFGLTEKQAEEKIPLAAAQDKVLNFINQELLEPPFAATAKNSTELPGVYQFTIEVAGRSLDSYSTKDGKLFFPQAFELSNTFAPKTTETANSETAEGKKIANKSTANTTALAPSPSSAQTSPPPAAKTASPKEKAAPSGENKENMEGVKVISLYYRKWSFDPDAITVAKGDTVKLTLTPQKDDSDLILPQFLFSIPELGITKTVSETTVIEFKAERTGTFSFECGDCSGVQKEAMRGTLMVK